MEIDLTTPALLFSAISLIMLAYTNRFLSYAQLVRTLKDQYRENHSAVTAAQIIVGKDHGRYTANAGPHSPVIIYS